MKALNLEIFIMDDEQLERAQRVYKTLCSTLDTIGWRYEKNEKELSIECEVQSEDLLMEITICVDTERQLILLLSRLPFVVSEDKRLDVAIATSFVNNDGLIDGNFDFDVTDGYMFFRMTSSFIESEIGGELFTNMLTVSCNMIDEYNDKFFMLGKGMLSLEDFFSDS